MGISSIALIFFVTLSVLMAAAIFSLFKSTFKIASFLFILTGVCGTVAGALYFINFPGAKIVLTQFGWFFGFAPTLTFVSTIFLTLVNIVAVAVGVYSLRYLEIYKNTYSPLLTQFLMIVFVFGMQCVLLANNVFSFMVFWELMSISSFFLVLSDKSIESFNAAFLYFIMTHLGALSILGGFLILGGGSLNLNFSDLASASQALSPSLLVTSFCLLLFGFGSKAGLVPFHVWLPEAHPQAPSNISALMSGLMLKIAVYEFLLIVLSFTNLPLWISLLVMALGLISGFVGALRAALETDIKRVFAYSSIENMGIIFSILGLALFVSSYHGDVSLAAFALPLIVFAIFHAINHAFFKTALFLSSGVIIGRLHSRSLEIMGGIAKALPLFSAVFLLAILGALPLPPFGTFFGEWGFIKTIISLFSLTTDQTVIAVLIANISMIGLIGGLAVFAMIKTFAVSMLGLPRDKHHEIKPEAGDNLLIYPILVLVALVIVTGIFAQALVAFLKNHIIAGNAMAPVFSGLDISSVYLFGAIALFVLLAYGLANLLGRRKQERLYHTWDCGQAIDASMEYTATAFAAPIRFFFSGIIKRNRVITSEPIVPTNIWIRNYKHQISIDSVLREKIYEPIANLMVYFSDKIKTIQNGRIQYYLLILFCTLIIVLSIAL
ncbi:MAG: proton-conducting transporter membrane subunit [Candidatus Falkowbacteria bacterium]